MKVNRKLIFSYVWENTPEVGDRVEQRVDSDDIRYEIVGIYYQLCLVVNLFRYDNATHINVDFSEKFIWNPKRGLWLLT